jgi:hypothetical protein
MDMNVINCHHGQGVVVPERRVRAALCVIAILPSRPLAQAFFYSHVKDPAQQAPTDS